MQWTIIAQLILEYGLPFAEKVWSKWSSGKDVTQADFDELNVLANETPQSHLAVVASRAGLPMTDPRVVALAELIK